MNALILVDIQNDFLPTGALPVPKGDEVIAVANRVMPLFSLIVATQDWHPARHGSFAAQHPSRKPGELAELGGLPQVLWPVHCVQDTQGAAFAPDLDTTRVAKVFPKGTDPEIDSYSGFFDNGHRKATGLGEYLHAHGVTDVYVLGLATDYCVKATALDARQLGFNTHLILDGCRGVELSPGDVERALAEMRAAGVKVENSAELLTAGEALAGSATMKFHKKQIVVDATPWFRAGDHPAVTHPVPVGVPIIIDGHEVAATAAERADLNIGAIKTLEGWMLVRPGDFIIRGVQDEHYACKPDIFLKTYERLAPERRAS